MISTYYPSFKENRKFFDEFFKLNYAFDPSELIVKCKNTLELYEKNVVCSICEINADDGKYTCVYEDNTLIKNNSFDITLSEKYGEFVGYIHRNKINYYGNLYDFVESKEKFIGDYILLLEKYLVEKCYFSDSFKSLYRNVKEKLSKLKYNCSPAIIDLNPLNYLYDISGNIASILNIECLVIAPPELELVLWEKKIGENAFKDFIKGYELNSKPDFSQWDAFVFITSTFTFDRNSGIKR